MWTQSSSSTALLIERTKQLHFGIENWTMLSAGIAHSSSSAWSSFVLLTTSTCSLREHHSLLSLSLWLPRTWSIQVSTFDLGTRLSIALAQQSGWLNQPQSYHASTLFKRSSRRSIGDQYIQFKKTNCDLIDVIFFCFSQLLVPLLMFRLSFISSRCTESYRSWQNLSDDQCSLLGT